MTRREPPPLAASASTLRLSKTPLRPLLNSLVVTASGVGNSDNNDATAQPEARAEANVAEQPLSVKTTVSAAKMTGGLTLQSASKLKLNAANQRRKLQSRKRKHAAPRLPVTLEGDEPSMLAIATPKVENVPPKPEVRQPIGSYETKDNKWKAVIHGELEKFMYPSLRLEALYDTSAKDTSHRPPFSSSTLPAATPVSMPSADAVEAVLAATTTVKWEVEQRFQNATQSAPPNGNPRIEDLERQRVQFDTQLETAEGLLRKKDMHLLEAKQHQGYMASLGTKYLVPEDASNHRIEKHARERSQLPLGRDRGASLYEPHIVNTPQLIPRLPHTRKIIKEIQRHTTSNGQIQYYADKHNLFKKWKTLQVSELHKTDGASFTQDPYTVGDDSDDERRTTDICKLSPRSLFYHECNKHQILPEPLFSRIHEVPVSAKRLLPLPLPTQPTRKLSTVVATLVQAVHEQHTHHDDLVPTRDGKYATKKHHLALHLHHFGLGDAKLDALSKSLQHFQSIHILDLSDNRLTDRSIIQLLESLEAASSPLRPPSSAATHRSGGATTSTARRRGNDLRVLNLSQNTIGIAGCSQIARFLGLCLQLTHLDLSHTTIGGTEAIAPLTTAIETHRSLRVVNMAYNTIHSQCASLVGDMLSQPSCSVAELDVSWNQIRQCGAIAIGRSLRTNIMLCILNLAMNRFSDTGGEQLAAALAHNATLSDLDLARNNLGGRSAIAFAFYLRTNRSLRHLRLEDNHIGATGAKALLKTVSLGSPCEFHVAAHDIESPSGEKDPIFDILVPSMLSPFTLGIGSSPYEFAVASELIEAAIVDKTCVLSEISFVDDRNPKNPVVISLAVDETCKTLVESSSGKPWKPPHEYGIFNTSVSFSPQPMRVTSHLDKTACMALIRTIERGFSSREKASLLALAVNDFYMSTDLADLFVNNLRSAIDVVEIVGRLWPCLLDGDRVYEFLQKHLSPPEQRRLIDSFGASTIQFTTANPTGRWTLNLGDRGQRKLAISFAILNAHETILSAERHPKRTDAAQYGKAVNWRNVSYNCQAIRLTYEFFDRLPTAGILEFDYVSTVRHEDVASPKEMTDEELENLLTEIGMEVFAIYIPLPKRHDLKYQLVLFHIAIANQFVTSTQAHRVLQYFPKNYESCRFQIIIAVHRMLIDMENLDEMLERLVASDRRRVYMALSYLNVVNPLAVDMDFEVEFERNDETMLLRALVDLSKSCPMNMIRIESERSTVLMIYSMYQTNSVPTHGRMCFRYVSHPIPSRAEFLKLRSAIFKHFLCGERLRLYVETALATGFPSSRTPRSSALPQRSETAALTGSRRSSSSASGVEASNG